MGRASDLWPWPDDEYDRHVSSVPVWLIAAHNLHTGFPQTAQSVAHGCLPFDPDAAAGAFYAGKSQKEIEGLHCTPTEGPEAFDTSERLHEAFDRLHGQPGAKRHRDNVINDAVFGTIAGMFDHQALRNLTALRHRFIAHAADERSRADMDLGPIGTTLGELEHAQKVVVQIAQLISSRPLYASSHAGIVPVPQFDIFAALDRPFVPTLAINDLHRFWNTHMEDRARWTHEPIQLIP